ncbi:MAG: AarF/ABC1/UbiB kinase family protein [Armatimonadota bacterium]|nr:AarF/ABC1/UbiB kinase family protein [Armatimonadota bacterium]
MLRLQRWLRHIPRLRQIAGILFRYFGYHVVDYLGMRHLVPSGIRPPGPETDFPSKLRAAIGELGPTFIKLGQVLSTRPDVVPPRYLEELAKLQDEAPAVSFSRIKALVESELGRPLEALFRYFAETPLASASLGQAHSAILLDGTPVVVKVQRPGIRRVVERDIEILFDMARFLTTRWEQARVVDLVDLVEEFQMTTRAELDYLREGRNMERLREALKSCPRIHVPTVYWDLTTSRVLTMERVRGTKVTDVAGLRERGIDPRAVAQTLGEAFMKQIFLDGFLHADPHPGNIVVLDDGTVTLLDFGMVTRLDESLRDSLTALLMSFAAQDSRLFAEEILELGRALRPIDRKEFTADADRMLRQYYDLPARDINIGVVFNDTLRLCTHHLIQTPSNFGLLVKVLVHLDGIAKVLDPDYSYLENARRFVGRALAERMRWNTLSLDVYRGLSEAKRLILRLPTRGNQVLTRLVDGDLRFQVELKGIEESIRHYDRIGNRISYSLIVAALLIGSGLFAQAQVPPFIRGYPVIAIATFTTAVIMSVWLLVAIIRSGNLR